MQLLANNFNMLAGEGCNFFNVPVEDCLHFCLGEKQHVHFYLDPVIVWYSLDWSITCDILGLESWSNPVYVHAANMILPFECI